MFAKPFITHQTKQPTAAVHACGLGTERCWWQAMRWPTALQRRRPGDEICCENQANTPPPHTNLRLSSANSALPADAISRNFYLSSTFRKCFSHTNFRSELTMTVCKTNLLFVLSRWGKMKTFPFLAKRQKSVFTEKGVVKHLEKVTVVWHGFE